MGGTSYWQNASEEAWHTRTITTSRFTGEFEFRRFHASALLTGEDCALNSTPLGIP
jgi:hypothetical protein